MLAFSTYHRGKDPVPNDIAIDGGDVRCVTLATCEHNPQLKLANLIFYGGYILTVWDENRTAMQRVAEARSGWLQTEE